MDASVSVSIRIEINHGSQNVSGVTKEKNGKKIYKKHLSELNCFRIM
jgi:hypothetical protein